MSMLEGVGCVGPTDVCEMERSVQNELKVSMQGQVRQENNCIQALPYKT